MLNLHYTILGSQPTLTQLNAYAGTYKKAQTAGATADGALDAVATTILDSDAAINALMPNLAAPKTLATKLLANVNISNAAIIDFIAGFLDGTLNGGKPFPLSTAAVVISNYVASYKTGTSAYKEWDADLVAAQKFHSERAVPEPTGQTFTLTTGADSPPVNNGSDNFIASEATLSSADSINGGAGTDLLRYASSGAANINEAGFVATSIETVSVTSDVIDATLGTPLTTTFDVTGVSGLTKVINDNSSANVVFSGGTAIVNLEVQNVSGGNTDLVYAAGAVAAATNSQNVALRGNVTIGGGAIGTLTANGIETFAITSSAAPSRLSGVASTTLNQITVAGDAAVNLGNVNFQAATAATATAAANSLDASTFTGALTVRLANNNLATDVSVVGGSGNDRVDFGASYDKLDSFNGAIGTDIVAMTNAVATKVDSTDSGTLTNVEVLAITDGGTGAVDMDNFAGVTEVRYERGLAAATSVVDTGAAITVAVFDNAGGASGNGQNLTVDLKTDGSADVVNLQLHNNDADTFGTITTADNAAAATASEYETVNIVVADNAAVDGIGTVTVANLVTAAGAQVASTMTITGNAHMAITAATTNAAVTGSTTGDLAGLVTLDASAATGNLNLIAVDFQSVASDADFLGATIKLGAGADKLAPGTGIDNITLGAGKDIVYYGAVAQSDRDTDTITDFVSGTDIVNVGTDAVGNLIDWDVGVGAVRTFTSTQQFAGNRANFAEAQGSLAAGGVVNAVFQVDTATLWVDANGDGNLDNLDFRVKLPGVTALKAADLGIATPSGKSLTLIAAGQIVNATSLPEGTTPFDDTVTTTLAFLNTSKIDGLAAVKNDTLVLSDAGTVALGDGATGGTLASLENLTLANGVNKITFFPATGFKNVTGGTGSDTVTTTNLTAGGTISLGDGNDVVNFAGNATTVDLGSGDDTFTSIVGGAITSTIAGGTGTDTLSLITGDNISGATISGFENLTLAAGATVTMTNAQYAALTGGTVTAGGVETVTFSDVATVTAVTAIEKYNIINKFTSAVTADQEVVGGSGDDSFTFTAGFTTVDTIDGGAGIDKLTIGYDLASNFDFSLGTLGANNVAGVENLVYSVPQTANSTTTLDPDMVTFDASVNTKAATLVYTNAAMTSVKLGSGVDTIATVVNTAAVTIDLGAGADIITALNVGTAAMTVNSGTGNLTITNIASHGTGVLTLQFTPSASATTAVNVAGTTLNFAVGDVFDFTTNVTAVVTGAANGINGVNGRAGQLFVDQTGGNTLLTFDADGDRLFGAGDVQISIVGNLVNGGITDGNFVIGTSA